MVLIVKCIVDRPEEYTSRKGNLVKTQRLTCQDQDASGYRLTHMFDYTMTEEEKERYAGRLMDKELKLGITEFSSPQPGRIVARGKILEVPSLDKLPGLEAKK